MPQASPIVSNSGFASMRHCEPPPIIPLHAAQALAPVRPDGDDRAGAVVRGGGAAARRARPDAPRRWRPSRHRRAARRPSCAAPAARAQQSDQLQPGRPAGRAGGGQHHGQQGGDAAARAGRGPVVPLLLRQRAQPAAAADGPGLRRHRLGRRLPADQQPCGRRRQRHRRAARRRPPGARATGGHRPRNRPGAAADHAERPAGHHAGRHARAAGGRRGAGHRQPLQRRPDRHLRHRQRARAQPARPVDLRELHPDRRGHQPGQFRRRAGRCRRAGWSASTPPSTAAAAAAWASASPSRWTRPAW